MTTTTQTWRPRNPRRVRAAQQAMFPAEAGDVLSAIRDVLCEPTRAMIVRALMAAELTVGDIAGVIGRSQSSTSQHLRTLRGLGLVRPRRRGRSVYYALATSALATAASQVLCTLAEVAEATVDPS